MFSSLAPPPLFRWPAHAPALQSLQTRGRGALSGAMEERLRELGIYREETQEAISQTGEKIKGTTNLSCHLLHFSILRYCKKNWAWYEQKEHPHLF